MDFTGLDERAQDVPEDWKPLSDLCKELSAETTVLADRVVERIKMSRGSGRTELRATIETLLKGLAERRGPRRGELAVLAGMGRRRAVKGRPLQPVLVAVEGGAQALWDVLVEQATDERGEARVLLLGAASMYWRAAHDLSEAVSGAFREQERVILEQATRERWRFFDGLRAGHIASGVLAEQARELGFDPAGPFRTACAAASGSGGPLPQSGRRLLLVAGHGLVAAIGQGHDAHALASALAGALGDVAIGVGLERSGLAGARMSLGDAERALALSVRSGRPRRFDSAWLAATLLASEERLAELLEIGRAVAVSHPELAETVTVFSRSGFSQSAAARTLGVHGNTVGYRLGRWQELTGWDARSHDGLTRTLLALELWPPRP